MNKESFLEQANNECAELKNNKEAWQEYLDECKLWDITLADGLEN